MAAAQLEQLIFSCWLIQPFVSEKEREGESGNLSEVEFQECINHSVNRTCKNSNDQHLSHQQELHSRGIRNNRLRERQIDDRPRARLFHSSGNWRLESVAFHRDRLPVKTPGNSSFLASGFWCFLTFLVSTELLQYLFLSLYCLLYFFIRHRQWVQEPSKQSRINTC